MDLDTNPPEGYVSKHEPKLQAHYSGNEVDIFYQVLKARDVEEQGERERSVPRPPRVLQSSKGEGIALPSESLRAVHLDFPVPCARSVQASRPCVRGIASLC